MSLGSSRSHSESTQTGSRNFGSTVAAGNNLRIVATGDDATDGSHNEQGEGRHPESGNGNIVIAGSDIRAGNDASLIADNRIDLIAAQDTASQKSSNSSSSSSVGVGFDLSKGGGVTFNIAASQGRGNADGNDVGNINTHVNAGNTLTLQSEGDTNLKGAVASGKQVVADIGGDLNIASLQDTSTYDSQQQSAGFSVSFSPAGVPTGGSINASQSNIDSNYAGVTEQSGIKAGDNGYQVNVEGDTSLKGAVIAASDQAIADGKTEFQSGGTVTLSDIQNSASYTADAVGFSAGVGSQLGASGGTGSASGDASSTTKSGIGVSTKTDTTNSIAKIFDADKVTADVNAQVQITQAFSQVAPKAVGDYATGKLEEAQKLRDQARTETDSAKRDELNRQADALNEAWKEGGSARVALHTAVGALGGGLEGALGAGTTALTMPFIVEQIDKIDLPKEVKQTLILAAGAAIGGATGGAAGATTSVTEVGNNYLKHDEVTTLLKNIKDCKGNQGCIKPLIEEAVKLSESRNPMDLLNPTLAADVAAGSADLNNVATDLGTHGFTVSGGAQTLFNINTTQLDTAMTVPVLTAPPTTKHPYFDTYQSRQSTSLKDGAVVVVAATGVGKLIDMGVAAQTTPLVGGVAGVSGWQWTGAAGIGGAVTMGTSLLIDPNATPASLIVNGVGGAVAGTTKIGLNAAGGLANQWVPTTAGNLATYGISTSVGKIISIPTNDVLNTKSGNSWWTTPILTCGPYPRKPC